MTGEEVSDEATGEEAARRRKARIEEGFEPALEILADEIDKCSIQIERLQNSGVVHGQELEGRVTRRTAHLEYYKVLSSRKNYGLPTMSTTTIADLTRAPAELPSHHSVAE